MVGSDEVDLGKNGRAVQGCSEVLNVWDWIAVRTRSIV